MRLVSALLVASVALLLVSCSTGDSIERRGAATGDSASSEPASDYLTANEMCAWLRGHPSPNDNELGDKKKQYARHMAEVQAACPDALAYSEEHAVTLGDGHDMPQPSEPPSPSSDTTQQPPTSDDGEDDATYLAQHGISASDVDRLMAAAVDYGYVDFMPQEEAQLTYASYLLGICQMVASGGATWEEAIADGRANGFTQAREFYGWVEQFYCP